MLGIKFRMFYYFRALHTRANQRNVVMQMEK